MLSRFQILFTIEHKLTVSIYGFDTYMYMFEPVL